MKGRVIEAQREYLALKLQSASRQAFSYISEMIDLHTNTHVNADHMTAVVCVCCLRCSWRRSRKRLHMMGTRRIREEYVSTDFFFLLKKRNRTWIQASAFPNLHYNSCVL